VQPNGGLNTTIGGVGATHQKINRTQMTQIDYDLRRS
jgi:hypothetical protein